MGCSSTMPKPEEGDDFSLYKKGREYLAVSRIPGSNFYVMGTSVREDIARDKAVINALELGLHGFTNQDYLAVDNGDRIIVWDEEKQLLRNKYTEEELRQGVTSRGTYRDGELVQN